MRRADRETTIAVVFTCAAMLCFSVVPVFLRHFTRAEFGLDAWTVNAVRYGTAAVFWLPFVVVLSRRLPGGAPLPQAGRSVWVAALVPTACNLIGQVGWATCPYYADAPTIGFVIRTSFLFTVVFGFLFIPAERPLARSPLFLIGSAICVGGVATMFGGQPGGDGSGTGPAGLALILATALCWGAYAVCVRRCLAGYPLRLAFGVISLYTTAGLVVLMLIFGQYGALASLPARIWVLLVVSGLLGIAFGHVLYYRGIHGIGPVVASGLMLAGPFFTYLTSVIFLPADRISLARTLGGVAVVVGGLALVRAKARVSVLEK